MINFEQIYRENYPKIFRYISRSVDSEYAEDLTQEVFIKVNNSLKNFNNQSSIYTWIYRIAYNTIVDFSRRR